MSRADWYLEKACEFYKNKKFEDAIKFFSKAAEGIGEENVKVKALCFKAISLYELGIQCAKKQSFEEAKQKFDEARKVFDQI
ncbi:tetratricopeptide repeat protein [Methanosarcina sp. 2.H.A.1B.4]|uniref:tetratricopeptide repeat protein n=1 Tax=Methanosarcina sp. 2.H.A.1B.4 TaxID=1483600 RepID=UPI00064F35CE|nr:tetratricopeptide repeat protein [Methanosarcina sp. 2.H.A.1B.4]